MRSIVFLSVVAIVVLMSGCGDSDESTQTTGPATSTTSSAATTSEAPPSTTTSTVATTTTSTTTTTIGPPAAAKPLLVANGDGAFLIDDDFSFQLVSGPVELAVDDGRGGVVFQRTSAGYEAGAAATIIEYLEPDALEPRDLLVPTGEQYLRLWDVSGGEIWYSRTEGDSPETRSETLRTYDLAARTVDEFAVTGGWESGSIGVSVGGGVVVVYWAAEAYTGFEFYESDSARLVGFEGDPYGSTGSCADGLLVLGDGTEDTSGAGCFEHAAVSDDGRLAFYERSFDGAQIRYLLVVVDLTTGEELLRIDLERPDQGWLPHSMDILDDALIVNRLENGSFAYTSALLVDLTTGTITDTATPGQARFLRGPMSID